MVPLPLTEGHRLTVFDSSVLTKIFGSKTDQVTRDWKKLHDEEVPDLFPSPNIGNMGWAGNVERMGDRRGVHRLSAGNRERKRPLGRSWRRRDDNIKMDFKEI